MTDHELLELAANAAIASGLNLTQRHGIWYDSDYDTEWEPLRDYGDALRLAISLGMSVNLSGNEPNIYVPRANTLVLLGSETDTRVVCLEIVRAAADIGRR